MKLAGYVEIGDRTWRYHVIEAEIVVRVQLRATDQGEVIETDLRVSSLDDVAEAMVAWAENTQIWDVS